MVKDRFGIEWFVCEECYDWGYVWCDHYDKTEYLKGRQRKERQVYDPDVDIDAMKEGVE